MMLRAISAFIKGADVVVVLVGVPRGSKVGGPLDGFMLNALSNVVAGMKAHGVRRLLFQVGGFTVMNGEAGPGCCIGCLIRDCVLGRCMGERLMLKENQRIAEMLEGERDDIDWTLARPGMLKDEESKGTVTSIAGATDTVMFCDLAEWEVRLLDDPETIHTAPFPGYAKGVSPSSVSVAEKKET